MIIIGKQRYGSQQPSKLARPSKIDRRRQQQEQQLPMKVAALSAQLDRIGRPW